MAASVKRRRPSSTAGAIDAARRLSGASGDSSGDRPPSAVRPSPADSTRSVETDPILPRREDPLAAATIGST